MPLTGKGEEILSSMKKTYGSEEKAKQVLYASKNAGKITGIDEYTQAGDPELTLTDLQEQNRKFWEQSAAKGQQVDTADDAVEMPGGFSPNLPEGYKTGPSGTENPASLGGAGRFEIDEDDDDRQYPGVQQSAYEKKSAKPVRTKAPTRTLTAAQATGILSGMGRDDNEEALEESVHPGLHKQVEALKTAGKHAEKTEYAPAKDDHEDVMVHDPTGFQVTGDRAEDAEAGTIRSAENVSRRAAKVALNQRKALKPDVVKAYEKAASKGPVARKVPTSGYWSDQPADEDAVQGFKTSAGAAEYTAQHARGPVGTTIGGQKVVYGNESLQQNKNISRASGAKVASLTPGQPYYGDGSTLVGTETTGDGTYGSAVDASGSDFFPEMTPSQKKKKEGKDQVAGAAPAVATTTTPTDQGMHPAHSLAMRSKGTIGRMKHNLRDEKDFVAKAGEVNLPAASDATATTPTPARKRQLEQQALARGRQTVTAKLKAMTPQQRAHWQSK